MSAVRVLSVASVVLVLSAVSAVHVLSVASSAVSSIAEASRTTISMIRWLSVSLRISMIRWIIWIKGYTLRPTLGTHPGSPEGREGEIPLSNI